MDKNTLILFTRFGLGDAHPELQQKLAGIFLGLLNQANPPGVLASYGDGVKLVCDQSPVLDSLQALATNGATLVVCQTCLDFFGLRERVRTGVIGGMGDIVAAIASAGKVLSVQEIEPCAC